MARPDIPQFSPSPAPRSVEELPGYLHGRLESLDRHLAAVLDHLSELNGKAAANAAAITANAKLCKEWRDGGGCQGAASATGGVPIKWLLIAGGIVALLLIVVGLSIRAEVVAALVAAAQAAK